MKLKLSLLASLAASVLCASGIASATPLDKKFSAEPAISVVLTGHIDKNVAAKEADITKVSDQANKQAEQQHQDAAQIGAMQCNEGNQQSSAATWTVTPAVISFYGTSTTGSQQVMARVDTGQANAENVLSAKTAAMTMANASIVHDSAPVGSWATSTMTNEARAQHQQSATASYTLA